MSFESKSVACRHTNSYDVISLADQPEMIDRHNEVGGSAWPEFMLHDPVAIDNWARLMAYFAEYQVSLVENGEIIAVINAVPLYFTGEEGALPDRGVDWGVQKSVHDHESAISPNCMIGMQVVVAKAHRGKGLSQLATVEMLKLARREGLEQLILPIRPSDKHRFPLISMEHFLTWTRSDGLPYDSWLRVHHRLGGRVIGVCGESMIIPGTVEQWSSWTALEFPGSGSYVVPGALNPVDIDLDRDEGVYREPNVWVIHSVNP